MAPKRKASAASDQKDSAGPNDSKDSKDSSAASSAAPEPVAVPAVRMKRARSKSEEPVIAGDKRHKDTDKKMMFNSEHFQYLVYLDTPLSWKAAVKWADRVCVTQIDTSRRYH